MPVPETFAASTSPSPAKVPPVIDTVAPGSFRLSGSVTVTVGDRLTVAVDAATIDDATFDNVGGSLTLVMLMNEVTGVLASPALSVMVQVTVRVALEPKSVGFSPA